MIELIVIFYNSDGGCNSGLSCVMNQCIISSTGQPVQSSSNKAGSSSGTLIGAVVGSILGVILIAVIVIAVIFYRRRQNPQGVDTELNSNNIPSASVSSSGYTGGMIITEIVFFKIVHSIFSKSSSKK